LIREESHILCRTRISASPFGFITLRSREEHFLILWVRPFGRMSPPGLLFTGLVSTHHTAIGRGMLNTKAILEGCNEPDTAA